MAEPTMVQPDPENPYAANHEVRILNLDTGQFCRSYETVRGWRW